MPIDDHVVDLINGEALTGAELLQLVEFPVIDGNIDVQVAEDRELLALLDQILGALALRVALLHHVYDWDNVPVAARHLFESSLIVNLYLKMPFSTQFN